MPQDDFELDFVLVRGPSSVDRRLHVRLPRDGTPVTVGRATHCTALLDPSLLFASQVHCSLFAVPVKARLSPAPARTTTTAEAETPGGAGVASTDAVTPAHQATATNAATFAVYVTDMCSSNGTFVNGLRISGTDATELQQGDVCIFGGMRDVEVGEALPADAYEGPELVLWRVDMGVYKESATHDFDFTATPLVLPAEDVLAAEVRALMQTAQRSMPKARQCAADGTGGFSVTPAAQQGGGVAASTTREAAGDDSPRGVPQQLFPSSPPPSPDAAVTVARRIDDALASTAEQSEEEEEPASVNGRRRSVSLVAVGVTDVPADPPAAMRYTAVRLGNVAFDAATAAAVLAAAHSNGEREEGDTTPGYKRLCRAADAADSLAAVLGGPPLLTCTATHFKWTMPNPSHLLQLQRQQPSEENTADALPQRLRQPFFGMLPITSVATVLACVVRRGIAMELRDGCELPLVDAAVTTGSAESRWVVWALSGEAMTEADVPSASASSGCEQRPMKRARTTRGGRKPAAEKAAVSEKEKGEAEAETAAAPADSSSSECASPAACFEAWLQCFRLFYGSRGVPPPHLVDAATFDLILAPPQSPAAAEA